jgi:GH15 family glucan-1,4-alpha-glucosidase
MPDASSVHSPRLRGEGGRRPDEGRPSPGATRHPLPQAGEGTVCLFGTDGLPPGEGAFLACSFWLVEALAIVRRFDEAEEVFAKAIRRGNDLGLFSEEVDVQSGALLGNFPQALTHIGLMNAALRLEDQRGV